MNHSKNILVLHPSDNVGASRLVTLIDVLVTYGASVKVCECDEHYNEILDEIEKADTLFFWA